MQIKIFNGWVLTSFIVDRLSKSDLYKTPPLVLSFIYDATGCSVAVSRRCCSSEETRSSLSAPPFHQFCYFIPATPEFFHCCHPLNYYNKSKPTKIPKDKSSRNNTQGPDQGLWRDGSPALFLFRFLLLFFFKLKMSLENFFENLNVGLEFVQTNGFNTCPVRWIQKLQEWYRIEGIKLKKQLQKYVRNLGFFGIFHCLPR